MSLMSKVWAWGGNTEGQLGLGEEAQETVYTPTLLPLKEKVRRSL